MKAPKNPKAETEPEVATAPDPTRDGAELDAAQEPEAEPAPEPWTAERVIEWNRYYDLYVAAASLLLVFLVATHKLANSSIWPLVQAGRKTLQEGMPILTDPFAYTNVGRAWVNVPWLYEVVAAAL